MFLPVSVIILTKNEERRIAQTLDCLHDFDDIWVVDSSSVDRTVERARQKGANILDFVWNGQYPKKKQWALDHVPIKYEWVLLLDADERITKPLCDEIRGMLASGDAPEQHGYFIKGFYRIGEAVLRFGQCNKKLSLFRRDSFRFPEIDDLDIEGGWEVEGHYQPQQHAAKAPVGSLKNGLIHDAYDDESALLDRHDKYARWEAMMTIRQAWPKDPVPLRQILKVIFRRLPLRGLITFIYSFVFKLGFLDGAIGYKFALARARYYQAITHYIKHYKKE